MTEKQDYMIREIRETFVDLAGDLLAIEAVLQCREKGLIQIEAELGAAYLQRQLDYVRQHTGELAQLSAVLVRESVRLLP